MTRVAKSVQLRDAAFLMLIDKEAIIDEEMPMYTDATRICSRHYMSTHERLEESVVSKYARQLVQIDRHGRPIHPQRRWLLSIIVGRMNCCSATNTPSWRGELRWAGEDLSTIKVFDGTSWQDVEEHDIFAMQGFIG